MIPVPLNKSLPQIDRLDLVESIFENRQIPDLENVIIIGAQHILPSTLVMLQSFFDRGLSPQNTFLIGKCYSTDFFTYNQLRNLGVNVCPSSFEFKKRMDFDSYYSLNINSFAKKILNNNNFKNKKIIIIDDGGELIHFVNKYSQIDCLSVSCLEQTSSGYQKIKNLNLNMGIVNVARSFAKLKYESKIVVKTAVKEIFNKISNKIINPSNVLVVGNGAIGNTLANALEGKFNVSVHDIELKKSDISYEEFLLKLSDFDLIIGCVGKTILTKNEIKKLKKGAALMSLSSSDREFEITGFRGSSPVVRSCHDDFMSNGIKILNCGFPVNFSGNPFDVDISEFELTRSLLTLGVLQAIEIKSEKGLIPISDSDQKKIIDNFVNKYPKF